MTPTVIESSRVPARALLFWHPAVESLAQSLLSSYGDVLERGDVTWALFPDGWPNIRFSARRLLEHRNVVFLASMHHPTVVVEQHAFMVALARQRLRSLHIVIPYFGPGTMERVSTENEVATAEPFFKLLTSSMPPLSGGGVPTMTVFDPHALVTRFYASDRVTVVQQSAFQYARDWARKKQACIIFPDDGASKRFAPLFEGMRMLTCAKKRVGDERLMCWANGEPTDADGTEYALIVDDLVQSGGTIAECAKLASKHFSRISAFCVHAIFPHESWRRFEEDGKDQELLEWFLVTNSNPSVTDMLRRDATHTFQVLDLSPLIGEQVRRDLEPQLVLERTSRHISTHQQQLNLVLASESSIKKEALVDAFERSAFSVAPHPQQTSTVQTIGVESGVRPQPLSEAEARQGAQHRLAEAIQEHFAGPCPSIVPHCDQLIVAIESGVWQRQNVWQDTAVVCVERRGKFPARVTVLSRGVPVPDCWQHQRAQMEMFKGARTLGFLIHTEDKTVPADAWFDRKKQLSEAIQLALEHV